MTTGLVIHIPHASTVFPAEYLKGIMFTEKELTKEILWATDSFCDELFNVSFGTHIVSEYSRLACDVERFRDDAEEPSARKGNGLLYTHTQRGVVFREPDNDLRVKALENIYDPHHYRLTTAVEEVLKKDAPCLIIDGHSFCDDPIVGDNLPDFCLGTDEYHTPIRLVEAAQSFLEGKG